MTLTTRRTFVITAAACGAALATKEAFAADPANKLDEASPTATGLGYKHDTTKADGKKYPQHKADQKCSGCQLFQGKSGDAYAACPLFAGKVVSTNGWCSAWVKKA